jgi:hypothetical protein
MANNLKKCILQSVAEWNKHNPDVQWVTPVGPAEQEQAVNIFQNNELNELRVSQIGFKPSGNYITLKSTFQRGVTIYMVDVLHEMMHIAGFRHEFARDDTLRHKAVREGGDVQSIGHFDYNSIMQYPSWCACGVDASDDLFDEAEARKLLSDRALNMEFEQRSQDTPTKTFSDQDKAAIKIIYGGLKAHHGTWHPACRPECSDSLCSCGNCGKLGDGANCGYIGMEGHWTCCFSEEQHSLCQVSHMGFWHAPCNAGCTRTICRCNNCGSGCTYEGWSGHWSCCNTEDFHMPCSKRRKPGF